ncbi:hypothetical protein [Micromonospora sp. M71_S20]|uniref:hypothetical protein n=1 Tax=Micromonospora sp. M71_S20 TaxID=592872 RepID=UPI0011E5AD2A|nr:hypothetical protein [Micromonospora sp. M71_S20]
MTVLSALELFNWWRESNWAAIGTSVLGAGPPADQTAGPGDTAAGRRWAKRRERGGGGDTRARNHHT